MTIPRPSPYFEVRFCARTLSMWLIRSIRFSCNVVRFIVAHTCTPFWIIWVLCCSEIESHCYVSDSPSSRPSTDSLPSSTGQIALILPPLPLRLVRPVHYAMRPISLVMSPPPARRLMKCRYLSNLNVTFVHDVNRPSIPVDWEAVLVDAISMRKAQNDAGQTSRVRSIRSVITSSPDELAHLSAAIPPKQPYQSYNAKHK